MIEYSCRACHRPLFTSDAPVGRLRLVCPYKDCRVAQMLYFGGQMARERVDRILLVVQGLLTHNGVR